MLETLMILPLVVEMNWLIYLFFGLLLLLGKVYYHDSGG